MATADGAVATATSPTSVTDDSIRLRRFRRTSNDTSPGPWSIKEPRRPSSMLSDSSAGLSNFRQSISASTDDFLHPKATHDEEMHQEPSLWHSLPLLFAILPAIAGVAFKSGGVFLTDLALLVLAAIYLNWCLLTPWAWYHSAQVVRVVGQPSRECFDEAGVEDGSIPISETFSGEAKEKSDLDDDAAQVPSNPPHPSHLVDEKAQRAVNELHLHELGAIGLCFLGPLLGSYILHIIRSSISQFGDELVSNMHLTMFVLAAEIRPLRYLMKMIQTRTLYLQRVVREDPHVREMTDNVAVQELRTRLDNMEKSYVEIAEKRVQPVASDINFDSVKRTQATLQNQIDALNRAVRRYEKRATAQTIQNEARMQDLELRLKEALSLAAAAANYSQKPSNLTDAMGSFVSTLLLPLRIMLSSITYTLLLLSSYTLSVLKRVGLVSIVRQRKSSKLSLNTKAAHSNGGAPRSKRRP